MHLTIQGLVLRVTAYNDKDALLTVLTGSHGKLTVKARGLYRKNSPLIAPCQLLAYGEFTLFEYRGFYTINEANTIELFHGLRKDLQKFSLGTYFAQVADVISQEDMPSGEQLKLILNCLHALDKLQMNERLIKAVFEFRSICMAGYMPNLDGCYRCGELIPDRFNLGEGRLECATCRMSDSDGLRMPITPGVLDAMRYISYCDPKKLFSFQIGGDTINLLSQLSESYLVRQLERSFSTLDFYKSLLFESTSGENYV